MTTTWQLSSDGSAVHPDTACANTVNSGTFANRPKPAYAEPTGAEHVATWRSIVLGRVLRYSFWAYGIGTSLALLGDVIAGQSNWRQCLQLGAPLLPFSIATFSPALPATLRAAVFSGAILLAIGSTMLQVGFEQPNPLVFVAVLVTISAVAIGKRFATVVLLAFIAILLGVGASHYLEVSPLAALPPVGAASLGNQIRQALVFGAATSLAVVAVSFLSTRMERTVARNGELFEVLSQENHSKLEALQAQQELQKEVQKAGELQALGRLATGVAHDFNNLLVVIINNAVLLQREAADDSLKDIQEAGARAARLCRQLLTIGRERVEQTEALHLAAAVEGSLTLVRRLMPPNIDVIVELSPDTGLIVGSEVEVEQIVLNLCLNARDAMPKGGQLRISTQVTHGRKSAHARDGLYNLLRIEDTGQGMDEQTCTRIFEPFFTTKNTESGTGLGLAVVAAAVEQTHGYLEVISAPGDGSSFSAYLPCAAVPILDSSLYPRQNCEFSIAGTETLLVVDDDDSVRQVLCRVLSDAGYQVIACANGLEALRCYRNRHEEIALLVSDAVMPHLSGRDLYEQLLVYNPDLPVVFCSGYAPQSLPPEYLQHPRRTLIGKPFTPYSLQHRVRQMLNNA